MPSQRHTRWRGRHPSIRWPLQRVALRARGERDAYDVAHSQFWCDTEDGVRLSGTRIGAQHPTAVVLAHGFMGYRTKPPWRILAEGLAERFTVFTFDLRGHGQSQGACSGGDREMYDVRAVVSHARARGYERVVTVGGSLGGIAVLLEAAAYRDIDGVVAISTPAVWGSSGSRAVRRMTWLFMSPVGRVLARRVMGTRIHLEWGDPPPPAEVVEHIAPIPLLIVHGDDDHFFPPSDAELLFARAREPKELMIVPGFGHAEDGFSPGFARALSSRIESMLGASWGPERR